MLISAEKKTENYNGAVTPPAGIPARQWQGKNDRRPE